MFARWWADQVEVNPSRVLLAYRSLNASNQANCYTIWTATNARRVTIYDTAGFTNDSQYLPWMVWLLLEPCKNTLHDLYTESKEEALKGGYKTTY